MPKKPPPEHTRFKPGQSGNPSGRPKDILTAAKLSQIIDKLSVMTRAQLQDVVTNPKTEMIELYVASIFAHGSKTGDYSRLEALLQRRIGKVQDRVEVSAKPYIVRNLDGTVHAELGAKAEEET